MKILILGGTGAMGKHLVDILAERGENVFVTTRSNRDSHENIVYIRGDAHSHAFLNELLKEKWDAIVDFMVYNTMEFQGRVRMLSAATAQYVFLSSSRVYANSETPLTEDSPRLLDVCKDPKYLATDEYALTKARQEDILRLGTERNWTIIRPYITFSEIRLQLGVMEKEAWLGRALQGKKILFSEDIASKMTTLTYGKDVARGIAAIIGRKEALCEAFHITQPKAYLWRELFDVYLDTIEKKTGKRPEVFMEEMSYRLKTAGRYQVIYDRYYNRVFDSSKIAKFVDIPSFISPKEGLRSCLEEFLNTAKSCHISYLNAGMQDRITREFSLPENAKDQLKYLLGRNFPFAINCAVKLKYLIKG